MRWNILYPLSHSNSKDYEFTTIACTGRSYLAPVICVLTLKGPIPLIKRLKLKNLLHIPTWCYSFITIASILAIISNLYFLFKIGTLETISIDGLQFTKGTVEYMKGVKEIKKSLMLSGLIAIAALALSTWKLSKRIKN
jgi:hypothetical protein